MTDNEVSMAIYRLDEQLIIHAVAPTEEDWLKSRQVPNLEEWYDYMAQLLETDAEGRSSSRNYPKPLLSGCSRKRKRRPLPLVFAVGRSGLFPRQPRRRR